MQVNLTQPGNKERITMFKEFKEFAMKREKESPPEEPTTKEYPHCFSVIPIEATRCGFCTSEL
jgi:large conductance mechanosensitive channel